MKKRTPLIYHYRTPHYTAEKAKYHRETVALDQDDQSDIFGSGVGSSNYQNDLDAITSSDESCEENEHEKIEDMYSGETVSWFAILQRFFAPLFVFTLSFDLHVLKLANDIKIVARREPGKFLVGILILLAVILFFTMTFSGTSAPLNSGDLKEIRIDLKKSLDEQFKVFGDSLEKRVKDNLYAVRIQIENEAEQRRSLEEKVSGLGNTGGSPSDLSHWKTLSTKLADTESNLQAGQKALRDETFKELAALQATIDTLLQSTNNPQELKEMQQYITKIMSDTTKRENDMENKLSQMNGKLSSVEGNLKTFRDSFVSKQDLKVMLEDVLSSSELETLKFKLSQEFSKKLEMNKQELIALMEQNYQRDGEVSPMERKELVVSWAKEAITDMTPSILAQVTHTDIPTAKEIVKSQESNIKEWATDVAEASAEKIMSQFEALKATVLQNKESRDEQLSAKVAQLNDALSKLSKDVSLKNGELGKSVDQLEKEVNEKRDKIDLDQETLDKIINSLKQDNVGKVGLTEEDVRRIVEEGIEVLTADRINRTDYALITTGAKIVHGSTADKHKSGFFASLLSRTTHDASIVLTPGNTMGHCFAFSGSTGMITIQLPYPVIIDGVSVDHISKGVSRREADSAPKDFKVWAVKLSNEKTPKLLGEFMYDINGKQVQTFNIENSDWFRYVTFQIKSNHGNEEYTCVYRLRVHGKECPECGLPQPPTDDEALAHSQQPLNTEL
eukprot:CAMPEP_0174252498 /NCGR_PEP_ID=MMETSP0439-20130205/1943_1 /TAXON_ID=0 /ORGANISM="Stereomyxa ramosa, Strain Chinc5" /LENGTH=730 /DNA_ID=CAMNT_0015333045 /DNA_START=78 /DNA_END=2270 /DNA_ORIENTATION=-